MKSAAKAAESGGRRELLEAMRERIAVAVDDPKTPARDLAALTRRLMDIAKELELLDLASGSSGDPIDQIGARRRSRGAINARGTATAHKSRTTRTPRTDKKE